MQEQEYLYKGPNHAVNLNNMRLKDKYCDVTINVNGKEIRAHKVILAANLTYFETMFLSDSFQESQGGVITMKSVEKADLELFVSYAYTGEILLTDSNALNLLELANYLSEDGIKEACIDFLEKHLKAEEACRAYKFANTIECLSLKNVAKAKIITDLENCSKSADYLNFDFESLMNILSDGKPQSIKMQKILFDGMMRWVLQDAKNRQSCLVDLLRSIERTKCKTDDVTNCLYKNVVDRNHEFGITKDTIFHYEASKMERHEQEQPLMIIYNTGVFQFYDFIEKKWSSQQEILHNVGNIHPSSAILNNKLYYICMNSGENLLQLFDPSSKQVTTLHFTSPIFAYAAVCACTRFLYICGGTISAKVKSDKILRYDPQTNSFMTLTPMRTKRSSAAAIFYQDCLFVLGGFDGSSILQLVEKYNPVRNEWTTVTEMCKRRRGHAVAILDGKLYVCGGHSGTSLELSVEVYDSTTNRWQLVASTNQPRDYSHVVAYKGKLLAIGGRREKTVEVYDPRKNQWQVDHEMSSGLQEGCCVAGFIPYSCITNT